MLRAGVYFVPWRIVHSVRVVRLVLGVRLFPFRVVGPAVVENPVLLGHLLREEPVTPCLFGEREPVGLVAKVPDVCPRLVLDRLT